MSTVEPTVPLPTAAHGGPVSHAIFRLARLHKQTAATLLRRLGLHPNQELVLMLLWDAGPQKQADLATVMESDSATITRTVQRLDRPVGGAQATKLQQRPVSRIYGTIRTVPPTICARTGRTPA